MSDKAYENAVRAVKEAMACQSEAKEGTDSAASLEREEARREHQAQLDKPMTKRQVMAFVKRLEAGTLSDDEEARHWERLDEDGEYSQQIDDEIEEAGLREACEKADVPYSDSDADVDWSELGWAVDVLEDSASSSDDRAEAEAALLLENLDDLPDEVEYASELTKADFGKMLEKAVRRGNIPESPFGEDMEPEAVQKAEAAVARQQKLQLAIRRARGDELADAHDPGTSSNLTSQYGGVGESDGSVDASEYD